MEYKYITEEDKLSIIENQLKQLEGNHFSLTLVEPSQLQEQDQHLVWKQQITAIEKSIEKMRRFQSKEENG
jgi:hypothetical protein|tara:strand:+ start:594 stop:806 length:213 start_codon:yes stop_codon:yes gene_type:complete